MLSKSQLDVHLTLLLLLVKKIVCLIMCVGRV